MAGVIRDIQCGMDVARMAELGRYDEEFLAYGFSWYEKEKRFYYLSNDSETCYELAHKKMLEQRCTTPIEQYLWRRPVPSGMYYEFKQQTQIALAKRLQERYTDRLFERIGHMIHVENTDSAFELLWSVKDRLEGRFHRDKLNYFQSILHAAYVAKKITSLQYEVIQKWLNNNFKQMENELIPEEQYEKAYGGFCYRTKTNNWGIYLNAQPLNVYEKWETYMKEGYLVFPIFWKKYWIASMGENKLLREKFKNDFIMVLQDHLGELMLQIKMLEPAVPSVVYEADWQALQKYGTVEEQNAWLIWGSHWDIRK